MHGFYKISLSQFLKMAAEASPVIMSQNPRGIRICWQLEQMLIQFYSFPEESAENSIKVR
jgi:hypothetical protein